MNNLFIWTIVIEKKKEEEKNQKMSTCFISDQSIIVTIIYDYSYCKNSVVVIFSFCVCLLRTGFSCAIFT